MKTSIVYGLIAILALGSLSYGVYSANVISSASELGGERWEISYQIFNTGAEAIEEMTIWFDYSGYNNFEITTTDPMGWSEIIIAADPLTESGAAYDILNTASPLGAGADISGFSVAFDYNGTESIPVGQFFEIIDPQTFDTKYASVTVPEPFTLSLMAAGVLFFYRRSL
jgi:hypothetical protein